MIILTLNFKEYHETLNAMRTMGMTDEEIESVLAVVSSILHMGNIGFEAGFKKQKLNFSIIGYFSCRKIY